MFIGIHSLCTFEIRRNKNKPIFCHLIPNRLCARASSLSTTTITAQGCLGHEFGEARKSLLNGSLSAYLEQSVKVLQQLVFREPCHGLAEAFQVRAQSHDRPLGLKVALSLGLLERIKPADRGTAGASDTSQD